MYKHVHTSSRLELVAGHWWFAVDGEDDFAFRLPLGLLGVVGLGSIWAEWVGSSKRSAKKPFAKWKITMCR